MISIHSRPCDIDLLRCRAKSTRQQAKLEKKEINKLAEEQKQVTTTATEDKQKNKTKQNKTTNNNKKTKNPTTKIKDKAYCQNSTDKMDKSILRYSVCCVSVEAFVDT